MLCKHLVEVEILQVSPFLLILLARGRGTSVTTSYPALSLACSLVSLQNRPASFSLCCILIFQVFLVFHSVFLSVCRVLWVLEKIAWFAKFACFVPLGSGTARCNWDDSEEHKLWRALAHEVFHLLLSLAYVTGRQSFVVSAVNFHHQGTFSTGERQFYGNSRGGTAKSRTQRQGWWLQVLSFQLLCRVSWGALLESTSDSLTNSGSDACPTLSCLV